MMDNIIKFPVPVTTDEYFGGCPTCGQSDGYLNVERDHVGICHSHKVCWPIGSNLFSSWQEQAPETFAENARLLSTYALVTPIYPAPTPEEAAEAAKSSLAGEKGAKVCMVVRRLRALGREYGDDPSYVAALDAAAAALMRWDNLIIQDGGDYLTVDAGGALVVSGNFADAL